MNVVREIQRMNETALQSGLAGGVASWHRTYEDSAYIFVGNLDFRLSEGDVIVMFSQWGEPVDINLVRDAETGKSKGFCFLAYEDQRSTVLAVDNFNGIKVLGRTIRVDHVLDYKAPKKDDSADVEDDTKDDDSSSIEEENVQENESNQTRTREELKSSKRAEVHGELQKEDPLSTMRSKIHSDLLSSESSDQEDAGEDALRENERHKRVRLRSRDSEEVADGDELERKRRKKEKLQEKLKGMSSEERKEYKRKLLEKKRKVDASKLNTRVESSLESLRAESKINMSSQDLDTQSNQVEQRRCAKGRDSEEGVSAAAFSHRSMSQSGKNIRRRLTSNSSSSSSETDDKDDSRFAPQLGRKEREKKTQDGNAESTLRSDVRGSRERNRSTSSSPSPSPSPSLRRSSSRSHREDRSRSRRSSSHHHREHDRPAYRDETPPRSSSSTRRHDDREYRRDNHYHHRSDRR